MAVRIADRVAQAAARLFVGREDEFGLLREALEGEDRPAVMFAHGPGGIRKSEPPVAATRSSWAAARVVASPGLAEVAA